MASVTYIKSIANNTPYTLTLINGENASYMFAIGAQNVWNGSMAIPWIGRSAENYKALRLILGPRSETTIWIFQDYWQPPTKTPSNTSLPPAWTTKAPPKNCPAIIVVAATRT